MQLQIDYARLGTMTAASTAAAAHLYARCAHGSPLPLPVSGNGRTVLSEIDAMFKGKGSGTTLIFDVDAPFSQTGLSSEDDFHALSTLYAWCQFTWDDVDLPSTGSLVSDDASIRETVDDLASKFDISPNAETLTSTPQGFSVFHGEPSPSPRI